MYRKVLIFLRESFCGGYFAWLRLLIKPISFFFILIDIGITYRKNRFFRNIVVRRKNPEKKALVVCFNGVMSGVKEEAWLALGLRLRGWKVEALMHHSHVLIMLYLRILGIKDFHHPKNFILTPVQKIQCKKDATKLISKGVVFSKVKQWHYKGVWIGPYILSSLQRKERLGALELNNPDILGQIVDLLPGVLEWVLQSKILLMEVRPDLVYLIEPNNNNRPLVDHSIRMGIDVVHFSQPNRDDALILKRLTRKTSRTHPNSISKYALQHLASTKWGDNHEIELLQEFENRYNGKWFMQSRNQPDIVSMGKKNIIKQLGLDSNKKTAAIFSHILWDANLFYGDDIFDDYADWFYSTVLSACNNSSLNWIVKLHPANIWKREFEGETGELSEINLLKSKKLWPLPRHVKLLLPNTKISTISLYRSIDYGITVRGTCGLELPCFGVPTLTAGTGRYSGLGFTIDHSNKKEYLDKLSKIQNQTPMTEQQQKLAKWHAYAIFKLRPWEFVSFKCTFGKLKNNNLLAYNVEPTVTDVKGIEKNNDLDSWVDWVEDLDQPVDYINKKQVILSLNA